MMETCQSRNTWCLFEAKTRMFCFWTCEQFVVHEAPGQELEVELFDEDNDNDDPLGK